MKFLFKFASRERPEKWAEACLNIAQNCFGDYTIITSLDEDDPRLNEYLELGKHNGRNKFYIGNSKSKVEAINRDLLSSDTGYFDVLICMSDDMRFEMSYFDVMIGKDMAEHFPDLDGCLHYNDGNQKGNCMTMTIMGRKYAEKLSKEIYRFNQIVIYHPSYTSLWCDAEATEVAHILGKIKYMGDDKILFRHLHGTITGEKDALFHRNENPAVWFKDKATFLNRRGNWYGIPEELIVNGYKYPNTI